MARNTQKVVLNIVWDDSETDNPMKWDWAAIVGDVWNSGDDLKGTAIPLTAMSLGDDE